MVLGIGEGEIDIITDKSTFRPGEKVRGRLVLVLNSPKVAKELRLSIVAEKKTYRNGKRRIETIYHAPVVLGREGEYNSREYTFEIFVPDMKDAKDSFGIQNRILKAASSDPNTASVEWHLDANLNVPLSMDINKRKTLNIV